VSDPDRVPQGLGVRVYSQVARKMAISGLLIAQRGDESNTGGLNSHDQMSRGPAELPEVVLITNAGPLPEDDATGS